ncbi:tRNA N6-adenosine threonylcarbamoyltransferase, mitochondrial [Pseudocercospora fuligena]|uniref:N(6)-L-threonylcarbamoyladenine synthase n=1 Tax=Pseudocercospora fuligena TaxID=685502 RepID=A0A8H6RQX3_9PEZI|nr:tRNA N6-adenosine threonylcarbamoyltransferase, mitochondrial [Pseudocercospora fuligena]
MRSLRYIAAHQHVGTFARQLPCCRSSRRCLTTLAIETSCDDTSVAVAELKRSSLGGRLHVHYHNKITANCDAYAGVHPLVALKSHRTSLAPLVQEALSTAPPLDFISVTRGPGMRSNLAVGVDTAKGLSLGLKVPILGLHHMQAHALTPRLVHAMQNLSGRDSSRGVKPSFPFLTVLASGGHTMLISSESLVEHTILAETHDIALGDCLDKAARAIVPPEALQTPYGKALEDFAFPSGEYRYMPPARRQEELEHRRTRWNWSLSPPFSESKGGSKTSRRMAFSFAGLLSFVERLMSRKVDATGRLASDTRLPEEVTVEERRELAREVQRVCFEHLASRILLHLSSPSAKDVNAIVVSGGVASNRFLRHVMRAMLDIRGHRDIALEFPPIELCTDNALMIAWAGLEMWNVGYRSTLDIEPIRKWSMDPAASDGGILGVGGWTNVAID